MDSFYDGDLKDIWDSDLDPSDSLKISPEADMNDWFLERDMKDSAVILNDKLISDALLNGTLPIKSEHSYSLNSDGDSLPDSPHSLHNKIDDMDDECYPAISFKNANSNLRHMETAAIDPKCLMISPPTSVHCSPVVVGSFASASGAAHTAGTLVTTTAASAPQNVFSFSQNQSSIYASLNKIASAPMTFNLRSLEGSASGGGGGTGAGCGATLTLTKHTSLQQQPGIQYLPQKLTIAANQGCHSPASTRDDSSSPDICSDIEIDEACIKDEPMSPDYSCPSSPNSHVSMSMAGRGGAASSASLSLSMANMAARTNSDLVFEHKNGCLQLTPASQSILKSQQLILGTSAGGQNIIIPKFNIKTETSVSTGNFATGTTVKGGNYGLPLTPPSSLSSDDSEGNLTPEHLLSPLSPNKPAVSISVSTAAVAGLAGTARRSTSSSSSSSSSTSTNANNCLSAGRNVNGGGAGGAASATTTTTTRQPIHTPLISTQPKGSTGNLILTEEEKRTLLAEGYPIPQKLPLTKAEEKSLKKIRRKIKNKISAQESRRKKKEYMDQLERKVEILVNENNEYRKRVETLEDAHASLLSQLHKLQTLVNKQNAKKSS